jgi:hypothetical protein
MNVGEMVPAVGGVVIATLGLSVGNFHLSRYDFSLPHCSSSITCSQCAVTSVRAHNAHFNVVLSPACEHLGAIDWENSYCVSST